MDRRAKIDALFRSVGTIEDPDAFRYVIEREPDDYVLADLRDRFWDGQGEKPWQVREINREIKRRGENSAAKTRSDVRPQTGDAHVQVARITERQAIIVAVISALAGIVSGVIGGRQTATSQFVTQGPVPDARDHGCQAYHLVVSSPRDGAALTAPFQLTGTVDSLPNDFSIWGVTTVDPKEPEQYWPAAVAHVRDRQWEIEMPKGSSKPGGKKRIAIFVVGPNGRVLIDYYRRAMTQTSPTSTWIPLTGLTTDMDRCAILTVNVQS